ncbi:unnamed protein product [Camellia sinensis]
MVYKPSIGAACGLSWPTDHFIVQVLDDSTNEVIRALVELECRKCVEKGVNVKYETRSNRNGYKAGALRDGLQKQYVKNCEFVAIFNADFQPDEDFLWKTIPYLLENPELGLVQARWKFVNVDECLMTRLQEMSLDHHFSVKQEVGSSTGTAGVWWIQEVNDAGGWKDRTTVKDMDLAVRARLKGWKFVFMGDLAVKNELPSTFKAYGYQQHRWSCGPANLFRKMTKEIILCEGVNLEEMSCYLCILLCEKDRCTLGHFLLLLRNHASKCLSSCPSSQTNSHIHSSIHYHSECSLHSQSLHLLVFWILFENVMSLHRSKAAIIGLLEANRVHEWVVTEKLGNTTKAKVQLQRIKETTIKNRRKDPYLGVDNGHVYAALCNLRLVFRIDHFFIYLLLQAGAFYITGFGVRGFEFKGFH